MNATNDLSDELRVAKDLARAAGAVILRHYAAHEHVTIDYKGGDRSNPVTDADRDANTLIVDGLSRSFPSDGILAEESKDSDARFSKSRLWCVDPLDGTQEFINRNGEFVVMIGLAIDGEASLGVVYHPTTDTLFAGFGDTATVENGEQPPSSLSPSRRQAPQDARLVISRSHRSSTIDRVARTLGTTNETPCGSVGLKASRVAAGLADVYVSISDQTREWDACAPEAILRAAGGLYTDTAGDPLRYNKRTTNTPMGMVATNGPLHAATLDALHPILRERGKLPYPEPKRL